MRPLLGLAVLALAATGAIRTAVVGASRRVDDDVGVLVVVATLGAGVALASARHGISRAVRDARPDASEASGR